MTFNWSEYIHLAEEMANIKVTNSTTSISDNLAIPEARLRSAISRAYYAAFCIARNYLRYTQDDPKLLRNRDGEINEHKYVADEFVKMKSKKFVEIGKDLSKLREYRNKSDYDNIIFNNNLSKLENEAKFCLKIANNIIENLNKLN